MAGAESYPEDLKYHPEHDWARIEGDEAVLGITWWAQDALGELVHFEAPAVGGNTVKDEAYGEVESVKAVSDVIAPLSGEILEVNEKAIEEPESINDDPYGEGWLVRIRLTDPTEVERPARRRGVPGGRGGAMTDGYLSLTDRDRDEMLAAIGVSSIDDLFDQIPEEVRFARRSRRAAGAHRGRARAAPGGARGEERTHRASSSRSSAPGIYDHYVPAIVDTILQRGEFLTAYTPYQPEMSQGVLQAIFEYQTAICELTGMDVSNASGYDGFTVAADACFIAKHATGRTRIVLAETLNPQVREVVKTYAPGFGLEVVEVAPRRRRHRPGRASPARRRTRPPCSSRNRTSSAASRTRPRSRPPPARRARSPWPMSTSPRSACSRRRARTAATWRSARGRAVGNAQSYGGPHYGFLASRTEFIRRLPGRIVGQTTDLDGDRGFVLTLQTREQHIRREKATSNMTTNQTLLALGGLVTLAWLGPQGLRELGETCMSLAGYARRADRAARGVRPARLQGAGGAHAAAGA